MTLKTSEDDEASGSKRVERSVIYFARVFRSEFWIIVSYRVESNKPNPHKN
jgi:hypothetical protein